MWLHVHRPIFVWQTSLRERQPSSMTSSRCCSATKLAMASFLTAPSSQGGPLFLRFSFLGEINSCTSQQKSSLRLLPSTAFKSKTTTAKFNLFEVMGGRGLCNGEKGVEQELMKRKFERAPQQNPKDKEKGSSRSSSGVVGITDFKVAENAFEKELQGLTGGFPGGERGLMSFIEKCPPPVNIRNGKFSKSKPKPPEIPLLMPGMIAIVKNPKNPFYMYCGIIQRITDGKAGVLFEGGNWDKLITFQLHELERREKGPPMVNPKSAVLEESPVLQKELS